MAKVHRDLPSKEQRDHLLHVVHADDPKPPPCTLPDHGDPQKRRHECEVCYQLYVWRMRMYRRFYKLNLRLTFDDREYDDPEPPACPHGHTVDRKNCEHCADRENWMKRRRTRMRRRGIDRRCADFDTLLPHLHRLRNAAMSPEDIARAANCGAKVVQRLLADTPSQAWVKADVARRLLDVAVPEHHRQMVPDVRGMFRRRIDAAGTRRRIQAACRNGHSLGSQARRLGWAPNTMSGWLSATTVLVDVADDVAELFPTLIAQPGRDQYAAAVAASKGWTEARYFSATNIDDPTYDPFTLIGNPVGVQRHLRALAWMGQGPAQVAAYIDEDPEQVAIWLKGGPVLAYAEHMVDDAFEALSGTFGPDDQAAATARLEHWPSPLAWYDIDVRDARKRPCFGLPRGETRSQHPLGSQVLHALLGLVKYKELLTAEAVHVVRILHQIGWSDRRIAAWLRWDPDGDHGKGRESVAKFRGRHDIHGYGMSNLRMSNCEAEDNLIFSPSAA